MQLFIGPMLLIIMVVLELVVFKVVKNRPIPWGEISMNLNSGHILLWVFRGFEVVGYHFLHSYALVDLSAWPIWLVWTLGFLLWDHQFYWLHRLHHKIPLLWYVHEVHHQGEDFNLSLGIRNSWFSSLTSLPFFIPMALIGFPTEVFVLVSSIHYGIQFYNHNDLVKRMPFLELFMVTPTLHKVHHAVNPEYINKNCGGTLNFWDRMYGTYKVPDSDVVIKLGLSKKYVSASPFWMNMLPFLRREKSVSKVSNNLFLHLSSFLLYVELLLFIKLQDTATWSAQAALFVVIFLGTTAAGGMHAKKQWGVVLWTMLAVGFCVLYMMLPDFHLGAMFAVVVLHTLYSAVVILLYINNLLFKLD
jgi:sterol desaturase/sphingolipid hydroxylase (fatty acid hydroxylase superfamily)